MSDLLRDQQRLGDAEIDDFSIAYEGQRDMDNYEIGNQADVNAFFWRAQDAGQTIVAIKGPPPVDAVYSDGERCIRDVNIGWVNQATGERIHVEWAHRCSTQEGSGDE